ncbi:prolyl oligopeptidase family serine peptidase [Streptomyces sp. B6B3]|uniref:prolyl oligopeptidase family serine peptidase n=1 Tax=Streptomyces sp. B6B3 TaxID=3153570 RepID=UPI00325DE99E
MSDTDPSVESERHMDIPEHVEKFPRQYARTRRFSLGAPRDVTVSGDGERVLFLRSVSGTEPRALLWCHEAGAERLLADPGDAAGVTAYAADAEARLVAYVAGGALWTVRTDGGAPRRLPTAGPEPVGDPRPSPAGDHVAYLAGGVLRVLRADGTDDRPLADPGADPGAAPDGTGDVTYGRAAYYAAEANTGPRGYWWSPGGDALLVARVDASPVRRRHLADPTDPERPATTHRYPAAGTPNPRVTLHLLGLDGGHVPVRLPAEVPTAEAPADGWGPAFEYVIADWTHAAPLVTVQSRDQRTAWILRVDPADGSVETLHRTTDEDWVAVTPGTPALTAAGLPVLPEVRGDTRTVRIGDVVGPEGLQVREVLAAVGERVWFTASEEPTETHVWSHAAGRGFERLTTEPGVHRAVAGGDTLVLDSRTEDGQTVTVLRGGRTAGRLAVLTEEPLVTPRATRLTLGRRESYGRLHLPSWYEPGAGRLPVLLCPYGGPAVQVVTRARGWWSLAAQWFAEQGFAVLAVDGRGTPGRGVAWLRAIRGDRLGPVLDDQIDALHDAAERSDALDLDRVGIRGWSYGGYLAAGAVLRRPDVFHAAVAGAAPTDRRLYNACWEERYLGHPELHPENYARSSLLPHAAGLSRPLMLVHGLADENVGPVHAFRLSAALLAAGRPHTVLPLPGVGHLVDREGTADALLRLELDFLRRALTPRDTPNPPTTPNT